MVNASATPPTAPLDRAATVAAATALKPRADVRCAFASCGESCAEQFDLTELRRHVGSIRPWLSQVSDRDADRDDFGVRARFQERAHNLVLVCNACEARFHYQCA